MPLEVHGYMNEMGEELFSLPQVGGYLEVGLTFIYELFQGEERYKKECPHSPRPVTLLPLSLIEKMKKCVESSSWRDTTRKGKIKQLKKCLQKPENLSSEPVETDHTIEEVKKMAQRFLSMVS